MDAFDVCRDLRSDFQRKRKIHIEERYESRLKAVVKSS